eukprot:TRINITY_DN4377_c0_g1_i1.p1 TRINITY_DN4377_c0_g1~~TRINITY_DN4377_c0_g1_i1.p1  ORF type:complete len:216 (+),score=65.60 TRINITY_DN4377_c0_g1_i1:84-731(+)
MSFLFGKQKTPQEMLREYKRMIDKSIRELDRERTQLQNQEKKIIAEMKKTAKQGQMGACKIMAKDLVRTRKYVDKFYKMRTQMQAVGLRLQTMKSTASMTDAMKGMTRAMIMMNRQINLPAMQQIMMEFEKQSELMDMKEEMMGDAIDDAMDDGTEEAESEDIVNQIFDEIGISQMGGLSKVPDRDPNASKSAAAPQEEDADADLQARLDALRRG